VRIGLFGGSFNPPHLGHLIVAEVLREERALDAVWWIPAHVAPHKTREDLAAAEHRVKMTRLAIEGHPAFSLETLELERPAPSYTVDTLRALRRVHPEWHFDLLVGSDSLEAFAEWRDPEGILRRAELVVYPRPGFAVTQLPDLLQGRVHQIPAPRVEISSSDIRRRVREGRSIRYLVPASVADYIEVNGLYA
jgi:nicotinate-nucleotide adenylyltransferase